MKWNITSIKSPKFQKSEVKFGPYVAPQIDFLFKSYDLHMSDPITKSTVIILTKLYGWKLTGCDAESGVSWT